MQMGSLHYLRWWGGGGGLKASVLSRDPFPPPHPLPKTLRGKALGVPSRQLLFAQLRNGGIKSLLIPLIC